jgi:RNA:NAD 2'-phosphotransferase (TPT1/KptA family)
VPTLAFHGTPPTNVDTIKEEGLLVPGGRGQVKNGSA